MKKLVIIALLIVGIVFALTLSAFASAGLLYEDGYVLQDNGIEDALETGKEEEPVSLLSVSRYDTLYTRGSSFYVGNEESNKKTKFNATYPQYIKDGSAVRIFDNTSVLITNAFDPVAAYQGLVVSEGLTYNSDYTRSDFEEYILIKLSNGLYMNTGSVFISTLLNSYDIPSNSIVLFAEEYVSYYSLKDDKFVITKASDVDFSSTITIGDNTMDYKSFLKALGEYSDPNDNPSYEKGDDEPLEDPIDKDGEKEEKKKEKDNSSDKKDSKTKKDDVEDEETEKPVKPADRPEDVEKVEKQKEVEEVESVTPVGPLETPSGSTEPAAAAPGEAAKEKVSKESTLDKIPDWEMPKVQAGDIFTPGVYSLKLSVKVTDSANVLVGGLTYEVSIIDNTGKSTLYKRSSFSGYPQNTFTTILVSGLIPESKYSVTGTFRYKDEYGRIVKESVVFMEPRTFETKPVSDLGDVFFEPFEMDTVEMSGDSIAIPHVRFADNSDQDTVASISKVIVRFTEKGTNNVVSVKLSATNLENLKSLKIIGVGSGKKLKSGTTYVVNIDCYDGFDNILEIKDSSFEARTCKNLPKATVAVSYNDNDATQSITVSITNSDNLAYSDMYIKVVDNIGNQVKINGAETLPITEDVPLVINNLSKNRTYNAQIYATCDNADGKGNIPRIIGNKNFIAASIGSLGLLYLTVNNITDNIAPTEKYRRAVFTVEINKELTNENLLQYIDVLHVGFTSAGNEYSFSLSEDNLKRLINGETITIDTDQYLSAGLSSNSKYKLSFTARKIYNRDTNDYYDIETKANLVSFITGVTPAKVLVDNVNAFEGFISLDVSISDVDQTISDDYALLKIYKVEEEKEVFVASFKVNTNLQNPLKVRMTSDASSSSDGNVYEVLADTEYRFRFVAQKMLTDKGLETNCIINSFDKSTNVSISGKIFNAGLEDNGDGSMKATIGMTMSDPEDFLENGTNNPKVIYVDEYKKTDKGSKLIETRSFAYTGNTLSTEEGWLSGDGAYYSNEEVQSSINTHSALPDSVVAEGYKQVQYIELSDNERDYINLQYKQTSESDAITVSFEINDIKEQYIVGALNDDNKGEAVKVTTIGKGDTATATFSTTKIGELAYATTKKNGISGANIYLFAANKDGIATGFASCKVYSCQIANGSVVKAELIPCVNSDNVPGVYDLVRNQFYSSVNGKITAGPEILYLDDGASDNNLPSRYVQVEYISSTGKQYINTGLNETNDTAIDLHIYNEKVSRNYLYGGTQYGGMIYNGLYGNYALEYNWKTIRYTASSDVVMTQDVVDGTNTIVINGETFEAATGTSRKDRIYIFACNNGSRLYTNLRLYYFVIKQGGNIVRDYVPCKDIFTGELGLYDLVEGKFYASATSTPFSTGGTAKVLTKTINDTVFFTSTVDYDFLSSNKYEYKMYFKYNLDNTETVIIPISSVDFSTNQEVFTISSGEEFIEKCTNAKKYVVINDIQIDYLEKTTALIAKEYADIDFQGFTFAYNINGYPLIENVYGSITNAVIKANAPLRRIPLTSTKQTTYHAGTLAVYNRGTFSNLLIEFTQEEVPHIYESSTYWSDLSPETITELEQLSKLEKIEGKSELQDSYTNQLANSKYVFPIRASAICVDNYGLIENFAADVKTPLYATDYCSAITLGCYNGGIVRNGYVYSSTTEDNKASFYMTKPAYSGNLPSCYSVGSAACLIRGKNTTIKNIFALVNVYTYDSSRTSLGIVVGRNDGSGAVVRDCYGLGEVLYVANSNPPSLSYGPVVGTTSSASSIKNVSFYSKYKYDNTYNASTSLIAIKSSIWQNNVLNSESSNKKFEVDSYISVLCFPQVVFDAKSMPAQALIPIPTETTSSSTSGWDIVYAYTYTSDPTNPYNDIIMAGITNPGNLAWKEGSEEQILCVMISNEKRQRVYSIEVNNFSKVEHDDIIYQYNNEEGITCVYVRMHDPDKCLTNYKFSSVTFCKDDLSAEKASVLKTTRYAYLEYFWRISDAEDWIEFKAKYNSNQTSTENMQLVSDIDFSGCEYQQYAWYNAIYAGKLIGDNYTVKNIDYDSNIAKKLSYGTGLTDVYAARNVGLFYLFKGYAYDLVIDNAAFEGNDIVGIFAATAEEAFLTNILVKNSYAGGGSKVGGLLGTAKYCEIKNCGVIDTKVLNFGSGSSSYRCTGGFIGNLLEACEINRSFVQNIYIESVYSSADGGFIGYQLRDTPSTINGCYATGTLITLSDFAGGFAGVFGSANEIDSCYSDVDIYSYGSLCGGFVGGAIGQINSVASFGNVSLMQIVDTNDEKITSTSLNSLRGNMFSSGSIEGYVYNEAKIYQPTSINGIVSPVSLTSVNSVGARFITYDDYLENGIFKGSNNQNDTFKPLKSDYFETEGFKQGKLPKLVDEDRNVLPGQKDEYIVSSSENASVRIRDLSVTTNESKATIHISIAHDKDISINDILTDFTFVDEMSGLVDNEGNHLGYDSFAKNPTLSYNQNDVARGTFKDGSNDDMRITNIDISNANILAAYDTYWLTGISYTKDGVKGVIRVANQLSIPQQWKEVASVNEWEEKVCGTHYENFRLTGDIDFNGKVLKSYDGSTNMSINRLVGGKGYDQDYTKENYYYSIKNVTIEESASWIREDNGAQNSAACGFIKVVASELAMISFDNIKMHNYYSTNTGIIFLAGGYTHGIRFTNIEISSRDDCAAISDSRASTKYIYLDTIRVVSKNTSALHTTFLFHSHQSNYYNSCLTNVIANNLYGERYGSGYANGPSLVGWTYYLFYKDNGSIFKLTNRNSTYDNITISNCDSTMKLHRAGLVVSLSWNTNYTNINISDSVINATSLSGNDSTGAGFVVGYVTDGNSCTISDIQVSNSTIKSLGYKYAGGVVGYLYCVGTVSNVNITDCIINGGQYTGGIVGYSRCTVTNSSVTNCIINNNKEYTGGAVGYAYSSVVTNVNVSNTTITATGYTGGLAGYIAKDANSSGTVLESTIYGTSNVGGAFGQGNTYSNGIVVKDCKITGTVEKVGGLIGTGYGPVSDNVITNNIIVCKGAYCAGATAYCTKFISNSVTSLPNTGACAAWINNCIIVGKSSVGGSIGATTIAYSASSLVENCSIYGNSFVGGIFGGNSATATNYVNNSYVKDSYISIITNEISLIYDVERGTNEHFGAIFGWADYASNCMADNCVVNAETANYVGAIGGTLHTVYSTTAFDKYLVSKDCIVHGNNYVGGMFGQIVSAFNSTYATVVNKSRNDDTNRAEVSYCDSNALVYGNNYVAGIAGKFKAEKGSVSVKYDDKKTTTYSNVYALTPIVKDMYFTGTLDASPSNGIAAGVFADTDIRTRDSSGVVPGVADYSWTIKLRGIAILPEHITANKIEAIMPSNGSVFDVTDLISETVPQYVSLWANTKLESSTYTGKLKLFFSTDNLLCDYVGDLTTVYDIYSAALKTGVRDKDDMFVAIVDSNTTDTSGNTELIETFKSKVLENTRGFKYKEYQYLSLIPNEYTPLEYIQSTGTQCIDTELNETYDTAVDLHIYNSSVSSNYLYGSTQVGGMMYNGLYSNRSLEYNWQTVSYTASDDVVMTQDVSGTTITIIINNQTFVKSTGTSYNARLYIFACNGGGSRKYTGMKLYYFTIKQGGVAVRNFVPVKRVSDNAVGLYDLCGSICSKTGTPFYPNVGTGTFIAGRELDATLLSTDASAPLVSPKDSFFNDIDASITTTLGDSFDVTMDQRLDIPSLSDDSAYKLKLTQLRERNTQLNDKKTAPDGIGNQTIAGLDITNKVASLIDINPTAIDKITVSLDSEVSTTNINNGDTLTDLSITLMNTNTGKSTIVTDQIRSSLKLMEEGTVLVQEKALKYNFVDTMSLAFNYTTSSGIHGFGAIQIDPISARNSQMLISDDAYSLSEDNILYKNITTAITSGVVNIFSSQNKNEILFSDGQIVEIINSDTVYEEIFNERFTKVEYIQTDGSQYFDLGMVFDYSKNKSFNMEFELLELGKRYLLFGTYPGTKCFNLEISAGNKIRIYQDGDKLYSKNLVLLNTKHSITVENTGTAYKYKFDSEEGTVNLNTTGASSNPIWLFDDLRGYHTTFTGYKLYSFTYKEGNQVKINLIPCIRKGDNTVGLYDTVNNKFYAPVLTSTNNTPVTAGPKIN